MRNNTFTAGKMATLKNRYAIEKVMECDEEEEDPDTPYGL